MVLKHVRLGVLDVDEIVDPDMKAMAQLYLRARRLRREIHELEEVSEQRRKRKLQRWLEWFGD